MKYIVVGLGNFGAYLSIRLAEIGHDVIGVDAKMGKIDLIKDKITHAVNLDATDLAAVKTLPFKDADVVIVGIGEDFGSSIMATAIFKQLQVKRLISRAISPLHETVLEAIGVDEIIHPEEESAERLSKRLEMKGVVDSLSLSENYTIVEVEAPERYIGRTIKEIDIRGNHHINVLTILRYEEKQTIFGVTQKRKKAQGVVTPDMKIMKGDILVLFGDIKDIQEVTNLNK